MQPTISDVHVNVPLTNLTLMYDQEDDAFVSDKVFPVISVQMKSDLYYVYNKGDFTRSTMQRRGPGTESAGGGYRLDNTNSYLAEVWALHKDIPDQIRANYDSMLQPDTEATRFLSGQARLNRELQWAATYMASGVWTTNLTGVATAPGAGQILTWDQPTATPIDDIRNAKTAVQLQGLYRPNKLVLARYVFDKLVRHPTIIDLIKYGQTGPEPAIATKSTLAQILELDEVLVMDSIQNTAMEDPAWTAASPGTDYSPAFIGGKNALLVYTPPAPGIMVPGCGYTFAWTGLMGATATGSRIKSFYMQWLESTRIEIDNAFVQKVVGKDLGCYFANCVP